VEPVFRADLSAALAFLRGALGDLPLALAGYSFGCSLLPHARADRDAPLLLIAPTLDTHEYTPFAALPNPLLVLAAEGDFAADLDQVRHWFDGLQAPRRLIQAPCDGHFFRGHEAWLAEMAFHFLLEQWWR
jgi:alpha/beta superfamily hydrolase